MGDGMSGFVSRWCGMCVWCVGLIGNVYTKRVGRVAKFIVLMRHYDTEQCVGVEELIFVVWRALGAVLTSVILLGEVWMVVLVIEGLAWRYVFWLAWILVHVLYQLVVLDDVLIRVVVGDVRWFDVDLGLPNPVGMWVVLGSRLRCVRFGFKILNLFWWIGDPDQSDWV